MTYEDELREEHQHELDQQVMDHELDAITYSERENANLHRAVERLERDNKKLVAALEAVSHSARATKFVDSDGTDPPFVISERVLSKVKQALAKVGE